MVDPLQHVWISLPIFKRILEPIIFSKLKYLVSSSLLPFLEQAKYYPSSNQFRDPPTYTHQPSMQQKVPFSLIRCSSSKVAFCSCVEWGWHIYNIVESESDPLTRRAVDLFEKEPLKGNSEVHLHTPTKFGEDRSKDLGGDREQTDRQTNRQTDKRCSIYSMICLWVFKGSHCSQQAVPEPMCLPTVTQHATHCVTETDN